MPKKKFPETARVLKRINERLEREKERREYDQLERHLMTPGFLTGSVYEIMEEMGDPHAWGSD